tara:strand:- start:1372 stop:1665 length:294 start_codon:yes stop_codon:yes gene_type:complete
MNPDLSQVSYNYVIKAIEEYDSLGSTEFFSLSGFAESKKYLLKYGSAFYPSKAIIGYAYNLQFPNYVKATPKNISGGINQGHAAFALNRLGFEIVDI